MDYKADVWDQYSGLLRSDWRLVQQEYFDKSKYKSIERKKIGAFKVRILYPHDDGFLYMTAICDNCQMKAIFSVRSLYFETARCRHCARAKE